MYDGGYALYGDGWGYGLGDAYPLLPPGDVLARMSHTELITLAHQFAQAEYTAKQRGDVPVAEAAKAARLAVSQVYTALGQKDLSKLDRAILALDRFNQVVGESVKELAVGVGRTAGAAVGSTVKGLFPVLPFALLALGFWAVSRGGGGGSRLW